MADWVFIPCLKALFAELTRNSPGRDKITGEGGKRLRYVVYQRRFWSAPPAWVQKAYLGNGRSGAGYDRNLDANAAFWLLDDMPAEAAAAPGKTWITNTVATPARRAFDLKLNP
jgi:hypothetical protein